MHSNHIERCLYRAIAYRMPVPAQSAFFYLGGFSRGKRDIDKTDGLFRRPSGRPGYPRDADGDIGARGLSCSLGHRPGRFGGYRSLCLDNVMRHTEQSLFGLVAVRDVPLKKNL